MKKAGKIIFALLCLFMLAILTVSCNQTPRPDAGAEKTAETSFPETVADASTEEETNYSPDEAKAEDPARKVGEFDFEEKTVLLNSGYTMPIMGLGTYSLDHDVCVNSVKALLKNGGRLIDTAYMYGNEEAVGEGVRQAMAEYGIRHAIISSATKKY